MSGHLETQIHQKENNKTMRVEGNPYYSPEQFGLEILFDIDTAGSYEFDMFVIWERKSDRTIWWATDSGCSCPTPFDDCDLSEITTDTYYNFKQALENHSGISREDIVKCEYKLKTFVRDHKINLIVKG